VQATLSTTEKKRGSKLIGVSAAATSKGVAVGAVNVTIAAGHQLTIVIALNATGRSLLARFGKLPVRLTVSLLGTSGSSTILSRILTVTPAPKAHAKH
jgi:hypothetical protein